MSHAYEGIPTPQEAQYLVLRQVSTVDPRCIVLPFGPDEVDRERAEAALDNLLKGTKRFPLWGETAEHYVNVMGRPASTWALVWPLGYPKGTTAVVAQPAPTASHYPDTCPRCGRRAYLGGGMRVLHAPDDHEECK